MSKEDDQYEFSSLWPQIEDICLARAKSAMGHADAQDLVSEFSFSVWSMLQDPKFKLSKNSPEHAKAYLLRIFKFRIIDFMRSRKRMNVALEEFTPFQPQFHHDNTDTLITLKEVRQQAYNISRTHLAVFSMTMDGWSCREIGLDLGMGASSVSRILRDGVARMSSDERVSGVDVVTSDSRVKTKRKVGLTVMASKLTFKQSGKTVKVISDKMVVALATINEDGEGIASIEVRKDSPISKESITSALHQHLWPSEKKAAVEETAAPAKAPAKAKLAPAKVDGPALQPKQGVNLDNIKDVPATIKEWQKKVGGEGYCLGGSGMPVGRRFKPGYDAKLKSCLKRLSTPNAKALAKELGWSGMIKFN